MQTWTIYKLCDALNEIRVDRMSERAIRKYYQDNYGLETEDVKVTKIDRSGWSVVLMGRSEHLWLKREMDKAMYHILAIIPPKNGKD